MDSKTLQKQISTDAAKFREGHRTIYLIPSLRRCGGGSAISIGILAVMSSSGAGVGGGRYMAFSPSPSATHSPHLSGLRSAASTALVEQEKYILTLGSSIYRFHFFFSNSSHVRSNLSSFISSDWTCVLLCLFSTSCYISLSLWIWLTLIFIFLCSRLCDSYSAMSLLLISGQNVIWSLITIIMAHRTLNFTSVFLSLFVMHLWCAC